MKKIAVLILLILSGVQVQAQEVKEKDKSLKIILKDNKDVVVYIDGKQYDPDIVELLDKDKIESVSVLKGKEAKEKYNAPDGVVLIVTKKKVDEFEAQDESAYPLVILDGKPSSREEIAKLRPNQIESVEVLKGDQAMKKYNAKNGAVIVTTKKKK
jgi:hypothetical protein